MIILDPKTGEKVVIKPPAERAKAIMARFPKTIAHLAK